MKISVITVCKNSEKSIEKTIKSVISQSYKNIEYIIIDGNSEDGTKKIINQFSNSITNWISEPDRGVYEAMNKGIKIATGDFLYFLNSDDYLFDEKVVDDVVEFIEINPDCDFVYGDLEARYLSGVSSIHQPALPEKIAEEMICLGNCPIQGASFFKASLFTKLGFFSEDYRIASDYEWFTRMIQDEALNLCYYPRTIVSYYCGGLSSNVRAVFAEVFDIQNQTKIYQTEEWLKKRIFKLQYSIINMKILLENVQNLADEREILLRNNQQLAEQREVEIAAMKKNKFWWLIKKVFQINKKSKI